MLLRLWRLQRQEGCGGYRAVDVEAVEAVEALEAESQDGRREEVGGGQEEVG